MISVFSILRIIKVFIKNTTYYLNIKKSNNIKIVAELRGLIFYKSDRIEYITTNKKHDYYPQHHTKTQNSVVLANVGESNEFSRLYYSEDNRWHGPYENTDDAYFINAKDYYYLSIDNNYIKYSAIFDYRIDEYTKEVFFKINSNYNIYQRLTANINARNIIKTHTYFINACTNTCTCKGFFYQKKCKHLKLINKFKADLFTNLVLLLKNYTNITMAIDIARDYV